jgi:multidrug efflux pump
MVLAIGLVVDDAIVVVENIHRHIEEGLSPVQAALVGTREIVGPVIAMTITLAAVYAPIGLHGRPDRRAVQANSPSRWPGPSSSPAWWR